MASGIDAPQSSEESIPPWSELKTENDNEVRQPASSGSGSGSDVSIYSDQGDQRLLNMNVQLYRSETSTSNSSLADGNHGLNQQVAGPVPVPPSRSSGTTSLPDDISFRSGGAGGASSDTSPKTFGSDPSL